MKKPLLLSDDAKFVKNLKYSYTPAKDIANYCKENHNIFTSEFAAQIEKRLMCAFVLGFKEAKPEPELYRVETPPTWWAKANCPEYFSYSLGLGMTVTKFADDNYTKHSLREWKDLNVLSIVEKYPDAVQKIKKA